MTIEELFFELIRVAIGTQNTLSRPPSAEEWAELYAMSKKQSLVGICFAGVQRLGNASYENQNENENRLEPSEALETYWNLPEMQYLTWMGMAAKIQQRNEVVNMQCTELQAKLAADGFRSYIMKGQSVATLYEAHLSGLRQSGDIDVYLEGGLDKVLAYARTFGEVGKVNELEMSVPVFLDPSTHYFDSAQHKSGEPTEVEFHYRPFIMRNPFKNMNLQVFFKNHNEANFCNRINLSNSSNTSEPLTIVAPTTAFNLVHQLVHTYHHFITEGVGLRQLMDYYFVIQASNADDIRECQKMVESLGLNRFASALMWVIKTVFVGHDNDDDNDNFFIWAPCEKDGRMLLDEILMSGNFGHTDERAKDIQTSRWKAFWFVNGKTFRFWRFDHWAWFWSPVWRVYHFLWRKMKGFK